MGKGRRPNTSATSPSDKPGACKDRCKHRVNKCLQTLILEKFLLGHQHLVFLIEEAEILWAAGLWGRKKPAHEAVDNEGKGLASLFHCSSEEQRLFLIAGPRQTMQLALD